jgi:hypothetical protein
VYRQEENQERPQGVPRVQFLLEEEPEVTGSNPFNKVQEGLKRCLPRREQVGRALERMDLRRLWK